MIKSITRTVRSRCGVHKEWALTDVVDLLSKLQVDAHTPNRFVVFHHHQFALPCFLIGSFVVGC